MSFLRRQGPRSENTSLDSCLRRKDDNVIKNNKENKLNTNFELFNQSLDLRRYPENFQNPTWQAWDSADEYLIEHIDSLNFDTKEKNLLILNEDCGALACWFARKEWKSINWINDSFVSTQSCKLNLEQNDIDSSAINFLDSLTKPQDKADIVILKIPKVNALLEYQLIELQKIINSKTLIVAAGKTKKIQKSTLALFEKYLGETTTSLAKKKSRLIFAKPALEKQDVNPFPTKWKSSKSKLSFAVKNHANVFAHEKLDVGGRFFLDNLPDCSGKTVIDLGSGNGVIGLSILQKHHDAKVIFIDESYMAVASAKLNVQQNFPDRESDCKFIVTNCLDGFDQKVDIILCNPPFHQQHGVTDHIAAQMFKDSKRALKDGGELRVIGNRHLDYPLKLKKLFGGIKIIASNQKFSVLSAVKK